MPQLDFTTFFSQAFWLVISFCLLWALLSWFITPKIMNVIEERKRKIDDYVQKAEKLNTQAKNALINYNDALAKAAESAEKQMSEGKTELKNFLAASESELTAKLNKQIADNELSLAADKKETLQQIEQIAEDLAYAVVQKLGFSQISKKDIAQLKQKDEVNG